MFDKDKITCYLGLFSPSLSISHFFRRLFLRFSFSPSSKWLQKKFMLCVCILYKCIRLKVLLESQCDILFNSLSYSMKRIHNSYCSIISHWMMTELLDSEKFALFHLYICFLIVFQIWSHIFAICSEISNACWCIHAFCMGVLLLFLVYAVKVFLILFSSFFFFISFSIFCCCECDVRFGAFILNILWFGSLLIQFLYAVCVCKVDWLWWI